MYRQNGGVLRDTCHLTGPRHVHLHVVTGIGYEHGIDEMSAYLIAEWDYPEIGVVLGVTESAGHDTVMLDYSACGPDGEPAVSHVDEDRVPRRIADSFDEFLRGLGPCPDDDE
ncbi:SMI1/KNR4 family protein [Micromonospora auratinigra]|uniref:SMI1/KNR4 family protein n=1 Tax=Micromonospora auratinigra TaxID=261654 RepID=UPI000AC26636|nr:SMI1/KNR4 family protein [Micromonospora auratinigra]